MSKPRWLRLPSRPIYGALVIALGALAAWGFWPRAAPVEVARVRVAPLEVGFTEEGRTRLRDRFVISAPVDGVVERITLEPGDAVGAGTAVAVLRPAAAALLDPATRADAELRWRTAADDRAAAAAVVAAAVAGRERTAASLRRIEALASRQQVALDQRDEARRLAASAEAELRSAQARLQAATTRRDMARAWLDLQGTSGTQALRLPLLAPIDGRVMRRHVESEGLVRAGQPLLEIGDPDALEVVVEVLSADALQLAPGMPARLDAGVGQTPVVGHIRTIEPGGFTKISALGVEEQRVPVIVDLPAEAPGWGDAYRVDTRFQVWSTPSARVVPVPALFRDGADWAVYAVAQGRARLRRVRLDHVGDDAAEVVEGLSEGDLVVMYPGDQVRDGQRVSFLPPK